MAFAENLAPFFDLTGFAEEAAWKGTSTVRVIFENPYTTPFDVAGSAPQAWVRDSEVPGVAAGQSLTIRGTAYTIAAVEPDGTGMTLLRLEKA